MGSSCQGRSKALRTSTGKTRELSAKVNESMFVRAQMGESLVFQTQESSTPSLKGEGAIYRGD